MEKVIGTFFTESCLPGSRDILYDPDAGNPDNLCSLCKTNLVPTPYKDQPESADGKGEEASEIEGRDMPRIIRPPSDLINCAADAQNRFYGNRGALACLSEVKTSFSLLFI
jgi:hypothetical protein